MSVAENIVNTLVNSLSMIDRGFTVTLTVTPHVWEGGYDDDYDEEDDIPDISEETVENIKHFSHLVNSTMSESCKEQLLNHFENLLKDKDEDTLKNIMSEMDKDVKDFMDYLDNVSVNKTEPAPWPNVGCKVWYKTKQGNRSSGTVKVVCHNTIQLDGNVTLTREDCMRVPYDAGDEVWFILGGDIMRGTISHVHDDNVHLKTKHGTFQMSYCRLFDTIDGLLDHLRSTADE